MMLHAVGTSLFCLLGKLFSSVCKCFVLNQQIYEIITSMTLCMRGLTSVLHDTHTRDLFEYLPIAQLQNLRLEHDIT